MKLKIILERDSGSRSLLESPHFLLGSPFPCFFIGFACFLIVGCFGVPDQTTWHVAIPRHPTAYISLCFGIFSFLAIRICSLVMSPLLIGRSKYLVCSIPSLSRILFACGSVRLLSLDASQFNSCFAAWVLIWRCASFVVGHFQKWS